MDETRLTGSLPNLDLEIVRRNAGDGRETVTVTMTATPTLGHAASALLSNPALALTALPPAGAMAGGAAMPVRLWMQMTESFWQPWVDMAVTMNPLLAAFAPSRRR